MISGREVVGGGYDERTRLQKEVFQDPNHVPKQNGNEFSLFSMAAVVPVPQQLDIKRSSLQSAQKEGTANIHCRCAAFFKIPFMRYWCPLTLLDHAMLLNYYNQEVLEEAYHNPAKTYQHAIYIDVVDYGGRIRVDTAKQNPLGEDWPDYGLPRDRGRTYPYAATLVGKNIKNACLAAGSPDLCTPLLAKVEAERGETPVQKWNDFYFGRIESFNADFDKIAEQMKANVMCYCTTPNQGTVGFNKFQCFDSHIGYCSSNAQCTATELFKKTDDPCA